MTPPVIDPETIRLVGQCLNHYATPGPVVLYRIIVYKQNTVKHNSGDDFVKVYFLHNFFQRHVSALVMSHLQVDYFFLIK